MLLLDFWMQYEENGRQTKRRFALHGDDPEFRLDLDSLPYIQIKNGKMFEIVGDNTCPFTPRAKKSRRGSRSA